MSTPFYKKFELNIVDNELTASPELRSECESAGIGALAIHLLELEETGNPSDLALEVVNAGDTYLLPLHTLRSRFLYQNGLFILDTGGDEKLYLQPGDFTVRIIGDKPFKATLYATGIPKV